MTKNVDRLRAELPRMREGIGLVRNELERLSDRCQSDALRKALLSALVAVLRKPGEPEEATLRRLPGELPRDELLRLQRALSPAGLAMFPAQAVLAAENLQRVVEEARKKEDRKQAIEEVRRDAIGAASPHSDLEKWLGQDAVDVYPSKIEEWLDDGLEINDALDTVEDLVRSWLSKELLKRSNPEGRRLRQVWGNLNYREEQRNRTDLYQAHNRFPAPTEGLWFGPIKLVDLERFAKEELDRGSAENRRRRR